MKASLETMVPLQGPQIWLRELSKPSALGTTVPVSASDYLGKSCRPHSAHPMRMLTVKAFWNFKATTITHELPFLRAHSGSGALHTLFYS